jgi:hypothetical protein
VTAPVARLQLQGCGGATALAVPAQKGEASIRRERRERERDAGGWERESAGRWRGGQRKWA